MSLARILFHVFRSFLLMEYLIRGVGIESLGHLLAGGQPPIALDDGKVDHDGVVLIPAFVPSG